MAWFYRKKEGELRRSAAHHMPLASAYLCMDCDCIGNCSRSCPACASNSLMGLSSVLDREAEAIPAYGYSYSNYPILLVA